MNDWNNDEQSTGAPGPQNPGVPEAPQAAPQAPPAVESAPQMPAAPQMPMADYSDLDVDEKVGHGNKGLMIAFFILLALAGVIVALWYKDASQFKKWDDKLQAAYEIKDDTAYKAAMRDIMQNCDRADILTQVAFELGVAKDVAAVPALAKAVDKGDELGQEAALALAKINTPDAKTAADSIFKQMQASKELRRAKYAWALVVLGDDRGFPVLLEGVSKQIVNNETIEDYDPELIAQMATTDKLIELAAAPDAMLRIYAAMELGFRDDKDPVPALLKLLADSNEKVAQEAAISLGRTADDRAGKALLAKISTTPDMLGPILTSITQSVGAPGLASVYANTDDPAIKYKILGKLKSLKDPRSADLLISITEEQFPGSDKEAVKQGDEIRNQALWTLESIGDKRIAEKMYGKVNWEPVSAEAIPNEAIRYRQDDMSRKIANGVVTWFGEVQPDGAAEILEKIYKENEPYENTPECAKRVKVDIGPLMDAMGRVGDARFCSIVEPFLTKDEGFYSQAASMALGRLQCKGLADRFKKMMVMTATERKEEKFSTLIESRDWQMEGRLQERRNSIIASRYLGDASLAETLMDIAMDPIDDPELRAEASNSLAYVADEAAMSMIVEKVKDDSLDAVARADLIKGLWHNPSKVAVEGMMQILEGSGNDKFVKAAAIVVGEAGDPAYEERLNKLLDHQDETRQRGAVMAIMLGGNLDRLDRVLEILENQENGLVLREWYKEHPVYLTRDIFSSKRIFKRLVLARAIADKTEKGENILWPWKYLMERLDKGWDTSPGGLTALQVRQELMATVTNDEENAMIAAEILRGMGERGMLLALQSGDSKGADVAREVVRRMNQSSS